MGKMAEMATMEHLEGTERKEIWIRSIGKGMIIEFFLLTSISLQRESHVPKEGEEVMVGEVGWEVRVD
jgi:hypothetical protein